MKATYMLLALGLLASSADAQDFCAQVKKEVTNNKVQTDYSSPFAPDNLPPVRVKRSISTDAEYAFDNFTVIFQTHCPLNDIHNNTADGGMEEKKEKTLVVTFDDNTSFTDDTTEISHDYTEDRTEAMRMMYFNPSEATLTELSSKKIAKFSLAGQEVKLPPDSANALMQYVKCIKSAK